MSLTDGSVITVYTHRMSVEAAARHGGGAISIVGLRKEFDGVTAVDGIDLEIEPGEFFTLLGPSGCGKTTTLRMLGGFEQPTAGQILIDGTDVAQTPAHKRPVNTVFQSYALFPHLDVRKNVEYGAAAPYALLLILLSIPATWLLSRAANRDGLRGRRAPDVRPLGAVP